MHAPLAIVEGRLGRDRKDRLVPDAGVDVDALAAVESEGEEVLGFHVIARLCQQRHERLAAAREELAGLYEAAGRTRDYLEQLEALAELEPTRAERLVSVGAAYARAGRIDAAVATLSRAAERYPDEPGVSTELGRLWIEVAGDEGERGAVSKALNALQPAATRASASSDTLTLYGRALLLSGDADAAELVLQQAVTRSPTEPEAYLYLARAAQRLRHASIAAGAAARYAALTDANP